ncbi:MAG: hypothetical protein QNJ31_00760 [Candidatus Caenarcaniphilales bacterium]|nr:hypothetical protein [Candidatus Caenarcaniphilales bacterium]
MKAFVFSLIVVLIALLNACSLGVSDKYKFRQKVEPKLSESHKEIINKITKGQQIRKNSPFGYWMFMVFAKDGHKLKSYTNLIRTELEQNGKPTNSYVVQEKDLDKEDFLHAGFFYFDKGEGINGRYFGFDLTGYGTVLIPHYNTQKLGPNSFEMDFAWIPGEKDNRDFKLQRFHRIINYDPKQDILFGTVDMYIRKTFPKDGLPEEVEIPLGTYVWKASRLSKKDFLKINNTGERNESLPNNEHVVAIDYENPVIKELVKQSLKES